MTNHHDKMMKRLAQPVRTMTGEPARRAIVSNKHHKKPWVAWVAATAKVGDKTALIYPPGHMWHTRVYGPTVRVESLQVEAGERAQEIQRQVMAWLVEAEAEGAEAVYLDALSDEDGVTFRDLIDEWYNIG